MLLRPPRAVPGTSGCRESCCTPPDRPEVFGPRCRGARLWPRTSMTSRQATDDASRSLDGKTYDGRSRPLTARGVVLLRDPPRHARVASESLRWRGVGLRGRWAGTAGASSEREGRRRGRGDRGLAGRRRYGGRRRARRPRADAASRRRIACQGPAHRGRPRAGGAGAGDGGPFAHRAGQAAPLRGGHGPQPRRVDGREERPRAQPVPPAGGGRGGRVPGRRRAAEEEGPSSVPRLPSCRPGTGTS